MVEKIYNDELCHYGVMGMRWGVRRDNRVSSGRSGGRGLMKGSKHHFFKKKNSDSETDTEKDNVSEKASMNTSGSSKGKSSKSSKGFNSRTDIDSEKSYKDLSDDELSKLVNRKRMEDDYKKSFNVKNVDPQTKKWQDAKNEVDNFNKAVNETKNLTKKVLPVKKKRLDLSDMSDQELRNRINREILEQDYNKYFAPDQNAKGREQVNNILDMAGTALTITSSALAVALAIKELRKKGD